MNKDKGNNRKNNGNDKKTKGNDKRTKGNDKRTKGNDRRSKGNDSNRRNGRRGGNRRDSGENVNRVWRDMNYGGDNRDYRGNRDNWHNTNNQFYKFRDAPPEPYDQHQQYAWHSANNCSPDVSGNSYHYGYNNQPPSSNDIQNNHIYYKRDSDAIRNASVADPVAKIHTTTSVNAPLPGNELLPEDSLPSLLTIKTEKPDVSYFHNTNDTVTHSMKQEETTNAAEKVLEQALDQERASPGLIELKPESITLNVSSPCSSSSEEEEQQQQSQKKSSLAEGDTTSVKSVKVSKSVAVATKSKKKEKETKSEPQQSAESTANATHVCLLCDKKGHNSLECQMICKNCTEPYHNLRTCPKPANLNVMAQYFMQFCMQQFSSFNPELKFTVPQTSSSAQNELIKTKKRSKARKKNVAKRKHHETDSETDSSSAENAHSVKKAITKESGSGSDEASSAEEEQGETSSSSSASSEHSKKRRKLHADNVNFPTNNAFAPYAAAAAAANMPLFGVHPSFNNLLFNPMLGAFSPKSRDKTKSKSKFK